MRLGNTNLNISRVGIGTAPIGSSPGWRVNWGPQKEDNAIDAIRTALDLGVNWIDTAPFYGWGRAEEIVGRAVKGRREELYIFTKCGTFQYDQGRDYEDHSPEAIRRDVEGSLRRLGTDHVDLLQIHDPDPRTPIEESWRTIQELIDEGKVRNAGLSNHPVDLVKRALKIGPVASCQVQYNPLERGIEGEMMGFCQDHKIGILGWGSLAEGFLADNFDLNQLDPKDFRRQHRYGHPENYAKILKVRERMTKIAEKKDKRLVDLVISWELVHPALTGAIIGIRNANEARQMMGGVDWALDQDEILAVEDALKIWTAV